MKKVILGSISAVALLIWAPAFLALAVPQAAASQAAAPTVQERIEQRLSSDQQLSRFDIRVSVDGGSVTLTGFVATPADKARAEQLATMTGVTRVNNEILVDPKESAKGTVGKVESKTRRGLEDTKQGAQKVGSGTKETAIGIGEKAKDGAQTVVDKTKEGLSKTGEVMTDAWITTRVKGRFIGEDLLKGSDIDVDTSNHVVTLNGTVTSAAGRAKAMAIAKDTEGVNRVVNRLKLGPKS